MRPLLLSLLLIPLCYCSARQVKNDIELEEAAKRAANGEESGWSALEKTIRSPDEEADIEMQRKALTEIGKIPSPRSEAVLKENATSRNLRAESIAGLAQQRNAGNKEQIDAAIVEAAGKNAAQYGGLTREEIKALGDSDNPAAVRLLKEQMGRDPNKDELAIDALGKILKRRKRTHYSPTNFLMPIGKASANLSFDDEPAPAAKPAAESKKADAAAAPVTPPTDENDPETVLLNFIATAAGADSKDRAVQNIAAAHEPGTDYLLNLAAQSRVPLGARIAILDYLTRQAVNAQDKGMIDRFYTLRGRSARDATFVASIDLSLRMLGNAFGQAVAAGGARRVYRVVSREAYEALAKESDIISLTDRPYPGYSGADVKTNLKKALKHYRLDAKIADRMQHRVNDLLNLPENKTSPERNLIFSALSRLAPNQDFYVLKKYGQDAFAKPGYFTTTLRLVTSSARGRSWQIAALQRLWGLSFHEADIIRQIYLRDGKILQQRMRL